jgi:uncharacterized damage-inducible protein DinB
MVMAPPGPVPERREAFMTPPGRNLRHACGMSEPHPLVIQLRFTRSEFLRGVKGVSDADGAVRLGPMNCIAWHVGHLAWQEQRYFVTLGQDRTPDPELAATFAAGAPGTTPGLAETLARWRAITAEADPWLDTLSADQLEVKLVHQGRTVRTTTGNLMQRTIYHYWFHNGENQAIRQQLGHARLGQFVGNIDDEAPYRAEPR